MNTETMQFEIVPADITLDPLAKTSLETAFTGFFAEAKKWQEKSELITDPKDARAARLEIKRLRIEVEKKHKEMKADSLLYGRAVDGAKNIFLALASPIEKAFEEIEKAEERAEAARVEALREQRAEILASMDHVTHGINLGTFTDDQWAAYLQQARDAHEARLAREKKEREEAEARAKKEAEEREAQRLENIRLKQEAEAREKELAEARRIADDQAAKAKAEREKIEAAAAKERTIAEAKAKAEAEAREKAEAEAKALREAEIKRQAEAEAKAKAETEAAKELARKAAAAPDRAKLIRFAADVRSLSLPTMKSEDGKATAEEIAAKVESFAKWIESQASKI
jgi:hypothetical protein